MTANPPLTPLAALRQLHDAAGGPSELAIYDSVYEAQRTLDHYTRSGWSGEDIKARRIAAGLTQLQLANAIGASLGTVRFWEQGRVRPSRAFRKPLTDLLSQPHERTDR